VSVAGSIVLLLTGLAVIAWWRLLKGKELARLAAGRACREHGLVLIDDTVMLDAVQLKKEDPVRAWGFRYRFEFAHRGVRRNGGMVLLTPGRRPTVVIQTDSGQVVEEF
jgi:hypothetical protein